jgi:hypothetical protein
MSSVLSLRRLLALVAVAAGSGIASLPASAASHQSHPSVAIGISPSRQLVKLPATGRAVTVVVRVQSSGSQTARVTTSTGRLAETPAGAFTVLPPVRGSATSWLKIRPASFTLRPGQIRSVRVTIHAPRGHLSPGTYALAVLFRLPSHKARHGRAEVAISPSVASELIVSAPGKIRHLVTYRLAAGGLSLGAPVSLTLTAVNAGTGYELLNNLTASHGVRFGGLFVLNNSARTEVTKWQPPALCLPCTVSLQGAHATVWALPGWPIIAGVAFLVLAVFLSLWRRHRQLILARARHRASAVVYALPPDHPWEPSS